MSAEPIISLDVLGRGNTGISEAKTKQLFEHHGLTYQTRRPSGAEPPVKMRRIDQAVRMRVRWTCHACHTVFASDHYCPSCGHRRCFDCHRDPVHRERAIVTDLRPLQHQHEQLSRNQRALPTGAVFQAISTFGEAAKLRDESQWQCTIQIGRPRPAIIPDTEEAPVQRPPGSRDCHECEAPAQPDQARCTECQHELCRLCDTGSTVAMDKRQAVKTAASVNVPVVERVYRKPRQRVRYNCERCDLQFTGQQECSGCGHQRCPTCPRYP